MSELRNCPHCGAENALETSLKIDLDDVVLESLEGHGWANWRVKNFVPAHSANDFNTGLVVEEANVSCRECGREVELVEIPLSIMDHWTFRQEVE